MSKKKNKFKKNKRANPQVSGRLVNRSSRMSTTVSDSDEYIEDEEMGEETDEEVDEIEDPYKTGKYAHVQKDIKKILIIMSFMVIVLFAVYFLSMKTSGLDAIGNWIYKILNLQAA